MSQARPVESNVGDVIAERYELEEEIGRGGMGKVFRARDLTLGRIVAVKILLPQYAVQEQSRKRFIREAKVTATLSHPCAISIFDFGVVGSCLYLVMELVSGVTLRAELTERVQLPFEEAVEVVKQIADVLVASHQLPLIHRDLKPENIMLGDDHVRVLDFGMAFIADNEEATDSGMGRLTREGLAGGTPAYMSPEQVQGSEVTPAADIYALGCVLFETLAGESPFDGPMMKILTKQMYQPAPDLRDYCPEAPQALVELVDRMLKKRPADRPSAETVRTRLEALGPVQDGERERSRNHEFLSTRENRMVAAPTLTRTGDHPVQSVTLGVLEPLDDETALALVASGISTVDVDVGSLANASAAGEATVDAILAIEPSEPLIKSLCAGPIPIVVASSSTAIEHVSVLLRAGVTEIVSMPLRAEELTKKLRRTLRKKQ